jgi:hypothetical protein
VLSYYLCEFVEGIAFTDGLVFEKNLSNSWVSKEEKRI